MAEGPQILPMKKPKLIHPFEKTVYIFAVFINIMIPALIILLGLAAENRLDISFAGESIWFLLGVIPIIVTASTLTRFFVQSDGIRLSRQQFPEIYAIVESFSQRLGMKHPPELFLYTGASASKIDSRQWFHKEYIFINDQVCKMKDETMEGLAFLIGCEFGHLQLGHRKPLDVISVMYSIRIPIIGPLLNRLRTYSADRYGAYLSPEGIQGLVFLTAGRQVYQQVELKQYKAQAFEKRGCFARTLELTRNQPYFADRLKALYRLGLFKEKEEEARLQ